MFLLFFFFNDTATTEIYTLSLHDALPISGAACGSERDACRRRRPAPNARGDPRRAGPPPAPAPAAPGRRRRSRGTLPDRKSTRLNSSHANISYAVFCLKKKKQKNISQ